MAIFSDSIQSEIEQDIVLPPGKDLRISHTGHLEASWVLANGRAIPFYQGFNRSFPVSQAHGLIRLKTFSSPADVTIDDSDGTSTQAAASYTSGGEITGSPLPGSTLTAAAITFAGSPTTVRQWWKNGLPTGVTALTYNVTSSNDNIYVIYMATNAGGKILHRSNTLKVTTVTPAPQVLSGGSISGATTPAAVLTASAPTYTNSPTSIVGTWFKNGTTTGVTTSTYSSTVDGDVVFVRYVATNSEGGGGGGGGPPPVVRTVRHRHHHCRSRGCPGQPSNAGLHHFGYRPCQRAGRRSGNCDASGHAGPFQHHWSLSIQS